MTVTEFFMWFFLGVGLIGLGILVWRHSNTPPAGYTFRVIDKGGSYEQVVIYDRSGKEVAGTYTSIYGLMGAYRHSIREAKRYLTVENRSNREYEKASKKFNKRS